MFVKTHLDNLRQLSALSEQSDGWKGQNPRRWWANYVLPKVPSKIASEAKVENLPDDSIKRDQLWQLCSDNELSDLEICICILAWGGMNRLNGVRAFSVFPDWQPVIKQLRYQSKTEFDHLKAYAAFKALRSARKLPGIGPAYFTKLIFFLPSCGVSNGFIMDQWTARAMNLLAGEGRINLQRMKSQTGSVNYVVTDDNDVTVYKWFCERVIALSEELQCDAEQAEVRIFSDGRGRGKWRNYVKSLAP